MSHPEVPAPPSPREEARTRHVLMASNRGPVTFEPDASGALVPRRGAGGLVTALTGVARDVGATWVASAMSPGDREMVHRRGERFEVAIDGDPVRLRYLPIDPPVFDRFYNHVSNSILWFLNHGMWDLRDEPVLGREAASAWRSYQAVNQRFAAALAEDLADVGPGTVLFHDYHLMLAAAGLRTLVPDVVCSHFTHTPWAEPEEMRVLPPAMVEEVLEGMLAHDLLGFQTPRWGRNFMRCCGELLGAAVDVEAGVVEYHGNRTTVRCYPIPIDVRYVRVLLTSSESARHVAWLAGVVQDRRLILRVDRMELSKNVPRGLLAYEAFLRAHPGWRGRVVHLALLYPSRLALPEYRALEAQVLALARRVNAELGSEGWQPIVLLNENNYLRALVALERYDVLVVNPIADGMNLVCKEGAAVNRNDGVLILSRNAGSWQELNRGALGVNPDDVAGTADAIHRALTMPPDARRVRARILREAVEQSPPGRWLRRQLEDLGCQQQSSISAR